MKKFLAVLISAFLVLSCPPWRWQSPRSHTPPVTVNFNFLGDSPFSAPSSVQVAWGTALGDADPQLDILIPRPGGPLMDGKPFIDPIHMPTTLMLILILPLFFIRTLPCMAPGPMTALL
jgi:hypothetical protein